MPHSVINDFLSQVCDSKPALHSLSSLRPSHIMIVTQMLSFLSLLSHRHLTDRFIWVHSHIGLQHNDTVDRLAKEACSLPLRGAGRPLSLCLSVCMYVCQSASVCLYVCLSGRLCLSLSVSMPLSLCLSICLSVRLSLSLSVCLYVCQFACLCLSICLSMSVSPAFVSVCLEFILFWD